MKKILIALFCLQPFLYANIKIRPPSVDSENKFAIIIDSISLEKTKSAVMAYKKSIENNGLGTFIVSADWQNPEQVKTQIIDLFDNNAYLEGVVFIGDIPVPMIRDAQHLTSAFKIDQNNPRFSLQRTSVPSDRFYDDFNLQFDFLSRDSTNQQLFYYSLRADSPQKIRSDIYSARIKVPVSDSTKYELLRNYLLRIARQKGQTQTLDNALVFTGHGYNSESLDAWSGAQLRYREQFPGLFGANGKMTWLNHAMRSDMKSVVMKFMRNPDLDMAVFHAHGGQETQYLLGFEPAGSLTENIEAIKLFLRSKMRAAKKHGRSIEETKNGYMERHLIPEDWFAYAFDDSVILQDSLLYASQDIYIEEIESVKPQPKFIYFDECYNGAFIHEPYVAGTYLFADGQTILTAANTVNVRQDIWATEFLGLLNYGMRIGHWLKLRNSLELHLLGDPTFHFNSRTDLNNASILHEKNITKDVLLNWLDSAEIPLQVFAIHQLSEREGVAFENKLIKIYKSSPSHNVRFQAMKRLVQNQSVPFQDLLLTSINDPAEIIRRMSVFWMGDVGKDMYIEPLLNAYFWDASARVRYNAKDALQKISPNNSMELCNKHIDAIRHYATKSNTLQFKKSMQRSKEWLNDDLLKRLNDPEEKLKKRISAVRTFRNYRFKEALPQLIKAASNTRLPVELRLTLIETLGWFGLNIHHGDIITACREILQQDPLDSKIKNEALKTINRIEEGLSNPITP